jgi:CubicO group peptidase (beta-lactamase class C family)
VPSVDQPWAARHFLPPGEKLARAADKLVAAAQWIAGDRVLRQTLPPANPEQAVSMRFWIAALVVVLGPALAGAESPTANPAKAESSADSGPDGVDAYVERYLRKRHAPGASVAVIKDGKVLLSKGYGLADVELGVPATDKSVYQLASVSKTFTAAAVMLLVREGKLALADKVSQRLSDVPAAWEGVTIRQLLNHTSGIKSYTSVQDFNQRPRQDFSQREVLDFVAKAPLEFAPGEKWNYSNTGYFLLGMLIEKASGQSYAEFMAQRIFRPLGMQRTRVNDLRAVIHDRARGYQWDGRELKNGEYVSPTQPFSAGALVSTVQDLVKWDAALSAGKLLDQATLDEMWTPTPLKEGQADYGYGWQLGKVNGRRLVSHGGGIPGFSTQLSRFVDDGLTVIVLINSDGASADRLARGIAGYFVPALVEKPPEPIADADPPTTERLRALVEGAQRGALDPSQFTAEANERLVPRIRADRDQLAGFGRLQEFQLLERQPRDDGLRLVYRATFANDVLRMAFALDKEGTVQGAGLQPDD